MGTAIVDIGSDLERKKWMREGLIQAASKSLFAPYTGKSKDKIVFQENNLNAADGHTVVFDFDGNLSQRAIKGKNKAFGQGETKKKFSSKVTVERYRLVVDNGDSFDGKNIGDLTINEHSDSRRKLGDLFVRFKDQALIDAAQGNLSLSPSHIVDVGTGLTINKLIDLETNLKTGTGFTSGDTRRPPEPYMTQDGKPIWLFVVDAFMARSLKKDTNYQSIVPTADLRGEKNRIFTGLIGQIGHLSIVEWPNFMGRTSDGASWGLDDSDIEIQGLRVKDTSNGVWSGQEGFDYAATLKSRGLILGAGALQLPFGKMPDYKFKFSEDFDIKSESALEVWMDAQKTRLLAENKDYHQAVVSGIDWGVIAIDVQV